MIHSTAIVSLDAKLAEGVEVGPYAIIEGNVEIGTGSRIAAHAVIKEGSRIGSNVTIESHAVIAGLPQDLSFDPKTETYAKIGDNSTIRESVTINRATTEGGSTSVGDNCFLMATCHLGHDTKVGNNVVIANAALLAGFVTIGDYAFLGGMAGVHQFCRVGEGVMFAGQARATIDVPPYSMFAHENALFGLNLIGLRRRGIPREVIMSLKDHYKSIFAYSGKLRDYAEKELERLDAEQREVRTFLEFFLGGKRGFARPNLDSKSFHA